MHRGSLYAVVVHPPVSQSVSQSVCLSVCHKPILCQNRKTPNHGKNATRQPRDSSFLMPKISAIFDRGLPPTGAPNAGGVGKNRRLSTNDWLYLENGTRCSFYYCRIGSCMRSIKLRHYRWSGLPRIVAMELTYARKLKMLTLETLVDFLYKKLLILAIICWSYYKISYGVRFFGPQCRVY